MQGQSEYRLHHRAAISRWSALIPRRSAPAPPQYYDGAINTVGLDIGVSAGSVLGWGVFAPTNGVAPGALAGEYVGVTGDVGFGIGGGANVLRRRLRAHLRAATAVAARLDRRQRRSGCVVAQAAAGDLAMICALFNLAAVKEKIKSMIRSNEGQ